MNVIKRKRRQLRCALTSDELTQKAIDHSWTLQLGGEIAARIAAERGKLKDAKQHEEELGEILRQQAEVRSVTVLEIQVPKDGVVLEMREDTGEVLSERKIVEDDHAPAPPEQVAETYLKNIKGYFERRRA